MGTKLRKLWIGAQQILSTPEVVIVAFTAKTASNTVKKSLKSSRNANSKKTSFFEVKMCKKGPKMSEKTLKSFKKDEKNHIVPDGTRTHNLQEPTKAGLRREIPGIPQPKPDSLPLRHEHNVLRLQLRLNKIYTPPITFNMFTTF